MLRAWTTWIGARLERRIAVQFVVTVLVTSALFAALALAGNAFLLRQGQARDMRRHVALAADRLAGKVSVLARGTVDLANNPLMATALLDSRGRDAYLRPFLANHRLPLSEAHGLTLCDFNGRPLASRHAAAPACFRDDPLVAALFRTEHPQWGIRTVEGRAQVLILQPVLYPGTGHAEGYAASTLDLPGALADAAGRDREAMLRLVDGDGTALAAVGDLGDAPVVWETAAVALDGLGELRLSRAERMVPPEGLLFLSGVYAGGVAVALMIALVLARRMANGLAAPLEALSRTAARIAAEGAASRPADVVGRNEVAHLAESFNRMLAALRHSQEGLEHQVSERTRALEEALSAVESSERRYRALFSGARVAMLLVDPADGAIVDANESAAAYYGYPADRLRTMTIGALNTLTADEIAQEMATARRQQRTHFHFRHRLAGGEVRDVEVHSGPIDLDGRTLLYSIVHDVTDRRRLEAERRHLTRQLQDVLSAASEVAIIATDRTTGLITLFNTGAQRMLGYTGEEVVGRCTPMLFHDLGEALDRARQLGLPAGTPDDALRALVEVAAREGRERREWTYVHKDGSRIAVSLAVTPVRADDGEITGFLGVAQDVTERRAAEAALKDSEERFRSLVESTTDWVWETDDQHRFHWFSPSFDTVLGTPSHTLIGKRREDLVAEGHEIESEAWLRHFADLKERRSFRDFRYWLRVADGTARWISISGSPRFDVDGGFLGYRGSGSDVTERAATSMRLRMLAQVVEQSPVSVVIADTRGLIEYANARLLEVTGWTRDELLGRHCRVFASGETPRETYQQLWKTITSGGSWIGEVKNRRKNGALYWELVAISPILDDDGRIVRYVGIKEDVTYRKEAEERIAAVNAQLNEQALQLQRSNAELEQFAYVASHDLRQPLRAVTNYLTLIERSLGDSMDEEIREFMGFAVGGAKRMDALIRDLLEYSRIGRKERPFEPVPLATAVADCLLDLEVAIGETKARVAVAEGLPTVRGDRVELTRLFQNLIGNAVKYRAPDRDPVVEVGWRAEGGEWLVWVRDNGIGIAPEDFDRAFGVFQRLVTREQYEGTGIGLAVCKKIVEHHGGRIWITSDLGHGSCFHVALPRLEEENRA